MTQIYDLGDPAKPVFVRNFGLPGQQPGSTGPVPTELHGAISTGPKGNRVYFGYGTGASGIVQIVDRQKLLTGPKEPTEANLTQAGAVLLREGRAALDAVEAADRRTRRAAHVEPGLVLVTKAGASGELLQKLLDAYAAEPGAITVDVLLCGPGEQERLLRDGRADVALLHRPFDSTAGFDTEELRTEGQVVLLPAGHHLSSRPHLRMADIAGLPGLPMPRWPASDGTYPDGPGPQVRDHAQLLQLIALGRASAVLPESVRSYLRDGLAAVPLLDAPKVTTVIAWPPHSRSRPLALLIRTATTL